MRATRYFRIVGAVAPAFLLVSCGGDQSTLSPDSSASSTIDTLWWVMLVGSAVVFAIVVMLLALGLLRRRATPPEQRRRIGFGTTFVALAGVAFPAVVIVALFILTLNALPKTSPALASTRMQIDVTARDWFWDVSYPSNGGRTANEIHIPVGVPVDVRVRSRDVIHSLWVPALNRKIDVIPGRTNDVVFRASRAGVFRGQCAEFCGLEHAHMALYVVAQPQPEFASWLARLDAPAPLPKTDEEERGEQVFMSSACEYCHRIAGTNATGTIGPDLTQVASRLSLAAGTIPNSRGYLAGWILDPQHLKPGNKMPATNLSGPQLQALLDYLGTLR